MFRKLQTSQYDQKAARLLCLAQIAATSLAVPMLEAFPAIDAIFQRPGFSMREHWDFFVTIAGLATGLASYSARYSRSQVTAFAGELLRQAALWDSQAASAIADFQQFVNRNVGGGVDAPTAIGLWVVWNIARQTPEDAAVAAAPAIGSLVIRSLQDWQE
jgi:hypothetical protein